LEYLRTGDGVGVAFRVVGPESGPVIVLTHGVSMDQRMWEPQVDALSDRYRVVVWDVRGHGQSPCAPDQFTPRAAAGDLMALLDEVGAARAVLVGHSLGGTLSQIAALEAPARLSAFVGIGCACITMKPSVGMRAFSGVAAPIARRMGPERMREDTAKRAGVKPSTRDYARDAAARMNDDMFARTVSVGFGDYAVVPGYHIGVPLLLMQGASDGYRPLLSSAIRWAKRDGGAYLLVPDAAHNAGQDNPAFVNEHLLAFLGGALRG
jgi:pimeloyl-ACP methyl ester carboxylesterase